MARRHALRDDQWERVERLLPGRKEAVGVTAKDNRLFVEAVLYRYRAGIPWRDLPERFGPWKAVHPRFSRRAEKGVHDRELCKERHLIESFFCKLKQYRAIASRHDKTARHFLAAIYLASTVIWLN